MTPDRLDANGDPNPLFPLGYCALSGHREAGCLDRQTHMALVVAGVGFSTVPGPSDRELLDETRADLELVADEFHGRAPGRW